MGLEHDSFRPLLESTGWLAAHRRSQRWLKQNPVSSQRNSLTGGASPDRPARESVAWHSWSLKLFNKCSLPAHEHPRITES
ncbi:MAG: hypothetical protein ACYC99_03940 [Candidatus Geothermincolia bacterium]